MLLRFLSSHVKCGCVIGDVQVKLCDLGISRSIRDFGTQKDIKEDEQATRYHASTTRHAGTTRYMAPECFMARGSFSSNKGEVVLQQLW